MCLVGLVHNIWHTGETPQELGWTILVLIPNGTTDTIGISMLETLWKVVEALIDTCLRASLQMNNILHGFRKGIGMGTAIMELKLAHELASIDKYPNHGPGPPYHRTGGVYNGPLAVWDLGDLLGLSAGDSEEERLPQNDLPRHEGYNTRRTLVPGAVQPSGGQYHKNLAGHDGGGPEGFS